jgi:heme/copper-type cytochrome/quinol oxidase subunit 3
MISVSFNQITLVFLYVQVIEFIIITVYMNESIYAICMFNLIGIHLIHFIIGIMVLIPIFLSILVLYSSDKNNGLYISNMSWIIVYSYIIQLVYWHFIDILWIVIYKCYLDS